MKIPKRITPDRIKDAIVQLYFKSPYPFELLIGYAHSQLLKVGLEYISQSQNGAYSQEINLRFNHLFIDGQRVLKIHINPDYSIAFNIVKSYPGWEHYEQCLFRIIRALIDNSLISSVEKIRVKYISEFKNIDLLENLKFEYNTTFLGASVSSSTSSLKWRESNMEINLGIGSKLSTPGDEISYISIIDIDILCEKIRLSSAEEITDLISKCHIKEKEIFFKLLKEDFLATLKPEY